MYDLSVYDAEFYELVEREGKAMAPWFIPLLKEVIDFDSLADVGCGTGHYLKWCADHYPNTYLLGIEGSKHAVDHSLVPGAMFMKDLRQPIGWPLSDYRFDLAISIEVAEHLEGEFADVYVKTLCSLGREVLITAAVPGQGGTCHVNEREMPYWVEKFKARGYRLDELKTLSVKRGIAAAKERGEYVTAWFEPNVAVFVEAK